MNKTEIARELGISKSYLSMILNGQRRLTPEIAEKLQKVHGVHKVVNFQALEELPKQDVEGSNPFTRFFTKKTLVLALMYH